ncbi:MAG: sulfatase-like hydrolase/transferase [Sedimentitalea sp.]
MNVLFMMSDELSWWALGHAGGVADTPNLDRLAARSMRFDAAYTPSPICVPTRAAIATGRDVHEIGCWSSAEPYYGQVPSWGHAVQASGQTCVSIGKLHYRSVQDDVGFDEQIEPVHVVDGVGWVQALLRRPVEPDQNSHTLARDIGPGTSDYLDFDRRVTAETVAWLGAPERQTAPWSAFVSWLCPHFPLIAPPEDFARYDAAPRPSEPVPDHPGVREMADFFCHGAYFSDETRGIAWASYQGMVTFLDRQVGQVLDALEAAGLAEDTLILFTSDHGEMLGEKGLWTKSVMYDSSARVPLLMAGPGVAPGVWRDPVSLIDAAPTICGAMGAACDGFSGVDLRAPVRGREVISQYHDGGAPNGFTMLRWQNWKLVYYAGGHAAQLFDMAADPQELQDLAALRADVLAEGMARLHARFDPEAVNARAFADQATRIAALGGADAIRAREQFDYTPADSR